MGQTVKGKGGFETTGGYPRWGASVVASAGAGGFQSSRYACTNLLKKLLGAELCDVVVTWSSAGAPSTPEGVCAWMEEPPSSVAAEAATARRQMVDSCNGFIGRYGYCSRVAGLCDAFHEFKVQPV